VQTFEQIAGRLHVGARSWPAHSGRAQGLNTPHDPDARMPDRADLEAVRNLGPIPAGRWRIGPPIDHPRLGRLAFPLQPIDGTDAKGRDGFFIHGPGLDPTQDSHGCVVAEHEARVAVDVARAAGDDVLDVVPVMVRRVA
jgi:hypothetical protein